MKANRRSYSRYRSFTPRGGPFLEQPALSKIPDEGIVLSGDDLVSRLNQFKGGQLATKISEWRKPTGEKTVQGMIKGDSIEFTQVPPNKHFASNLKFTKQEEVLIHKETEKLIHKGVIVVTEHEKTEFVSLIFIIINWTGE